MLKLFLLVAAIISGFLSIRITVPFVERTLRIATLNQQELALPNGLIALESDSGRRLLMESSAKVDFEHLHRFFSPQIYRSFCGVASGVIAKNALHNTVVTSQSSWFDQRPSGTRLAQETFFGGMSLGAFARLAQSHGLTVELHYGGTQSLSQFRALIRSNLSAANDLLVVNYYRKTLGQEGGGHFSPLAAYHGESDTVLILDVAAHRYPHVWVPVEMLWRAVDTLDKSVEKKRGVVALSRSFM